MDYTDGKPHTRMREDDVEGIAKRKRLKALMKEHQLNCPKVGELLNRSPQVVRQWVSNAPAEIPDHSLELLEIKLKDSRPEKP